MAPSAGRWFDREVAGERRAEAGQSVAGDVEESAAVGRVEPLVAAAGEEVDGSFADVEGDGAELLDGVDDEPELALATIARC